MSLTVVPHNSPVAANPPAPALPPPLLLVSSLPQRPLPHPEPRRLSSLSSSLIRGSSPTTSLDQFSRSGSASPPPITEKRWSVVQSAQDTLYAICSLIVAIMCAIWEASVGLLTDQLGHNQEVAAENGAGIVNGDNSCYMASVLQSLRMASVLHLLENREEQEEIDPTFHQRIMRDTIDNFYAILDHKTATANEMNMLRNHLVDVCFPQGEGRVQEDAAAFCRALLERLGAPRIQTVARITHDLAVRINDEAQPVKLSWTIDLPLDQAAVAVAEARTQNAAPPTTIANLIKCYTTIQDTAYVLQWRDSARTALQQEGLVALAATKPHFRATYRLHLESAHIPQFLPLTLIRYPDRHNKITLSVIPSETIELPLADRPTHSARFHLKAIVVHSGNTPNRGHYYTYIPRRYAPTGPVSWIEYNDSRVQLHKDPTTSKKGPFTTAFQDACEQGYLYFYVFDNIYTNNLNN